MRAGIDESDTAHSPEATSLRKSSILDRIAAAWLRSGVPLLKDDPARKGIKAHKLPEAALQVPLMCNLGTKEGVTVKEKNFAGVWPANPWRTSWV